MITTEVHTRTHEMTFSPDELRDVVAQAAADRIANGRVNINYPGVSSIVTFTVTSDGSDPQIWLTSASVVIIEDLLPQPAVTSA